jgi:hypothetical protein
MRTRDPRSESERPRTEQQLAQLQEMIRTLREALIGVAERELHEDALPCFCVSYDPRMHDEWCETARAALAGTADLEPTRSDGVNPVVTTPPGDIAIRPPRTTGAQVDLWSRPGPAVQLLGGSRHGGQWHMFVRNRL